MNLKNTLLAAGLLAIGNSLAAAAPTLEKVNRPCQRLDPAFVTPEYFIDGVWVQGPTVPYSRSTSRDVPRRKIVFDGAYAVDGGNNDWMPGIDPCSGSGYLFAANSDTASADHFNVQAAHMVNDYANMDPVGVNNELMGMVWKWHQFGEESALRVRLRWYDNCNTTNDPNFTGTTGFPPAIPTVAGSPLRGATFTYAPSFPGDWYTFFDSDSHVAFSPFRDDDGAFQIVAESSLNITARDVSFYLQGVRGTAAHPGASNSLMWIDDSGELGRVSSTHDYDINAAISSRSIQITGTAATGNESYYVTDPTCFSSGLGPAVTWWTGSCLTVQPVSLVSPENGAGGISNPVTCTFAPPLIWPVDFSLNIKLNDHNLPASMPYQNNFDITLTSALDTGRAYGWSITSNARGNCPGADSQTWTFRMAGCSADFNNDGVADFFDYLDFVNAFSHNEDFADFNADQIIDFFDYLDFVDTFNSGC